MALCIDCSLLSEENIRIYYKIRQAEQREEGRLTFSQSNREERLSRGRNCDRVTRRQMKLTKRDKEGYYV